MEKLKCCKNSRNPNNNKNKRFFRCCYNFFFVGFFHLKNSYEVTIVKKAVEMLTKSICEHRWLYTFKNKFLGSFCKCTSLSISSFSFFDCGFQIEIVFLTICRRLLFSLLRFFCRSFVLFFFPSYLYIYSPFECLFCFCLIMIHSYFKRTIHYVLLQAINFE